MGGDSGKCAELGGPHGEVGGCSKCAVLDLDGGE